MGKNKNNKSRGISVELNLSNRLMVGEHRTRGEVSITSYGRYATTAITTEVNNAWVIFNPDMGDSETIKGTILVKCQDGDVRWEIVHTGDLDAFIEHSVTYPVTYSNDPYESRWDDFSIESQIADLRRRRSRGFATLHPIDYKWTITLGATNDPGEVAEGIATSLVNVLPKAKLIRNGHFRRREKKEPLFSPMYFGRFPTACVRVDINMLNLDEMNLVNEVFVKCGITTNKAMTAFLHQFAGRVKRISKNDGSGYQRIWKSVDLEYDDDDNDL